MTIQRRKTSQMFLGGVGLGSEHPVSIQSMTTTDTRNPQATVAQIDALFQAGCEIVRVAVPDTEAAEALGPIITAAPVPVVADIHFDYRLALTAIRKGIHGLRINPGNIGDHSRVKQLADAAKAAGIPIRVGVNSGSVEKEMLLKYGGVTAEALVESALSHVSVLEKQNFEDIKISIKASDVPLTIAAYRNVAKRVSYPLHLGVTEAGTVHSGIIKSAVGIGALLSEGIGDTIRVSLTGDPVPEIAVAANILKALHLKKTGVEIISCPTCGRCEIDLEAIALAVERATASFNEHIKVAIMGCVVNGPGEAKEADLGIAGGKQEALLFKKGEIIKKVPEDRMVFELLHELEKIRREKNNESQ